MGCNLSEELRSGQCEEKPLSPRFTAPPPPPLTAIYTTIVDLDSKDDTISHSTACAVVRAGLGVSSASQAADAAQEAVSSATESLAAAAGEGHSPKPLISIVASGKGAATDAEDVRCELVRALPEALLHGATSAAYISGTQSLGNADSKQQCSKRADAVGCLLLEAPEGSFAAAWDDAGDALYAAKWLQEQMPVVQAIIMAAVPGQEEIALKAVQMVFPGISVYGSSVSKDKTWVTMSHLGSAEQGISLVGIGAHVGFGAAEMVPRDNDHISASLIEVYDAAMVAGCLKTATAGILTCRGRHVDVSVADNLGQQMGNVPILGLSCTDETRSPTLDPSIGIMLFGERHPQEDRQSVMTPSKSVCSTEDDGMSASTWPLSPATDVSSSESAIESAECASNVALLNLDAY